MAVSGGHEHFEVEHREEASHLAVGGSLTEFIAGLCAVVLSILALQGIEPMLLLPICTILVGISILFEGGTLAARFYGLMRGFSGRSEELTGGGMAMEALAGCTGIILGVLALIGIAPLTLISVATIIYGAAAIIGSGVSARLDTLFLEMWSGTPQQSVRLASDVIAASSFAEFMVSLCGVVLGILALLGTNPVTLTLVAMLVFGAITLLNGLAMGSRMAHIFSYRPMHRRERV